MLNHDIGFSMPEAGPSAGYWEDRARRFATAGDGLAAVCSYGMPEFYNRAIQLTQRLALRPWLNKLADKQVLDIGCGVGRWSRAMAARGAYVTGVDISPTMVLEASRRANVPGVSDRCQFVTSDLATLETGHRYQFILGVTVLQHILERGQLQEALRRLTALLADDGRMVLIEAAPSQHSARCDSPIFTARTCQTYQKLFVDCGLTIEAITGVDPMPLKTRFLPYYSRLPKALAIGGLAAVTALSLPVDAILGRRLVRQSWHKVFVLQKSSAGRRNAG